MALITMQVVRGTTSHFNQSTPFDAMVFRIMGGVIVGMWLALLAIWGAETDFGRRRPRFDVIEASRYTPTASLRCQASGSSVASDSSPMCPAASL